MDMYTVRVTVEAASRLVEARVRVAVCNAGGTLWEVRKTRTPEGGLSLLLSVLVSQQRMIPGILRSVEGVKGAAVLEITAPEAVAHSEPRRPSHGG